MSPNVDDLKQSRFLSKKDVVSPILVTIKSYDQMNVARQNAEPDIRYVLYFHEIDKPMTLTPTRGSQIRAITGSNPSSEDEFADWIGHKIVLYIEEAVEYGTETLGGIRCRAPSKAYIAAQDTSAEDKAAQEVIDTLDDSAEEQPIILPLQENPKKHTHGQGESGNIPPIGSEQESAAPF